MSTYLQAALAGILLSTLVIVPMPFVHAAETTPDETTPDEAIASKAAKGAKDDKEAENCSWACLRWGRLCNVDPRGVYKCHRKCEQFGQQCE